MKMAMETLVLLGLVLLGAGCGKPGGDDGVVPDHSVARGEYLVENVGMCRDCHSPLGPQGPDPARHLAGAELVFAPAITVPDWASTAPAIAGLPSLDDDDAIALLSTGALANGMTLRPPMPRYRLTRDDAIAVVAYLRSLASE